MDMPLISVIVPVYKTRRYLRQCVDSIRSQSYVNLEILLVDDGCPEGSGVLCDELAKEDPRIRVIHKENGGQSSARNAGLDAMQGEYVGFVDSDDWIAPEMYETLFQRMLKENDQVSCCGIARMAEDREESLFNPQKEQEFAMTTREAMAELPYNYRITSSPCDKLYRRELFDGLRMQEGMIYEDAQLQPYLLARAQRITYTGRPLYRYRLSQGSTIRGDFALRHFDCYKASMDRLAFYEKNFPQQLPYARMGHLETCLNLLYFSRGRREWDGYRKQLKGDLGSLTPETAALLSKKLRLKLAAARVGLPVYYLLMWVNGLTKKH